MISEQEQYGSLKSQIKSMFDTQDRRNSQNYHSSNLAKLGGDRLTVMQINLQNESEKLSQNKRLAKQHSFKIGLKAHLKEFQSNLKNRSHLIDLSIEKQIQKFDDIEVIQKNIQIRDQRQKNIDQFQKKQKYVNRGIYQDFIKNQDPNKNQINFDLIDENKIININNESRKAAQKLMNASKVDFKDKNFNISNLKSHRSQNSQIQITFEEDENQQGQQKEESESLCEGIPTMDDINFKYLENQLNCKKCAVTKGNKQKLMINKDPNHYQHLKKERMVFKQPRIKAEDLKRTQDGKIIVQRIKADSHEERKLRLEKLNPLLLKQEQKTQLVQDMKHLYQSFLQWQNDMWINLRKNAIQKEIDSRPIYINLFEKIKNQNLQPYLLTFDIRKKDEQVQMESVWKPEKELIELREAIKRIILNIDQINLDDYIENILIAKDKLDRQNFYFEQVKDLLYIDHQKTVFDKMHENQFPSKQQEINSKEAEFKYQKEYIDQTVQKKQNRQEYLQKEVRNLYDSKYDESQDAQIKFAKNCQLNVGLPLPEIMKPPDLQDGKFVIIDKSITEGQIISISDSFKFVETEIKEIYLCNNILKGDQISYLLQNLSEKQKQQIKSIIIKGQNELSTKLCDTLINMYLDKSGQYSLNHLKLIDVQIKKNSLTQQLLFKIQSDIRLQSLCLSRVSFDHQSFSSLITILNAQMPTLKNVDISWNQFIPSQMKQVFLAIRTNYIIQQLNLSFNSISESDDLKQFGNYVRQNPNLQHLNISGLLKTKQQVLKIVKKLKKSQSLLSIHMSQTFCIANDFELQKYIEKKLEINKKLFNIYNTDKQQIKKIQKIQSIKEIENEIDWRFQHELISNFKAQARDILYYENQSIIQPYAENKKSNFIISRTLAHNEIKGNKQWILSEDCYFCQRWTYAIFFHQADQVQGSVQIEGTFELLNHKYGDAIKMIDVREFARNLTEISGDFDFDFQRYFDLYASHEQIKIRQNYDLFQDMKKQFQQKDIEIYKRNNVWYKAIKQYLLFQNYQILPIRPITFDLDNYYDKMDTSKGPNLFIFADYMKPCKYFEKYQISENNIKNILKHEYFVVNVRKQEIPQWTLDKLQRKKKQRFDKEKSVFKEWIKDNPKIIQQSIQNDLSYWRIPKINKFKDDPQDLNEIIQTIKTNYEMLKHIFINLASESSFPNMGQTDLSTFCRQVGILDDTCLTSTIDRKFIETKVVSLPGAPGNLLLRNDFLDVLVRIARAKYFDAGRTKNINDSLVILIQAIKDNYKPYPWQEFRDEVLWKQPNHDVLHVNLDKIKVIYNNLFPQYGGNGMKNCIELMCRLSNLQMSDKEVKLCFGMSKMTIQDEVKNFAQYEKLKFVEFLEFLGRCAYHKYINEKDMEQDQKIEFLLDEVFAVYKIKRAGKANFADDENTSDESCFVERDEIIQQSKLHSNYEFIYQ